MFEEARLAYLNGLFFSVPVLVACFLEHEIAGLLFEAGVDQARRFRASELIREAAQRRMIDDEDLQGYERLNQIRNSLVHFRAPLEANTLMMRAMEEREDYVDIAIRDSGWSIDFMFSFVEKHRGVDG